MTTAVSLTAPQFDGRFEPILDVAQIAETFGYDGVFLFDHLVPLSNPHRPILELAATLGALAARTSRIAVGSLVMRAPLRGPAISAALAQTVAAVAPGRFILGLGAGDSLSNDEADRFGERRRSLDHRLRDVVDTLEATAEMRMERWVGGLHHRLLDVAATADGWNGWAIGSERFGSIASRLRSVSPGLTLSWGGSVIVGRNRDHLDDLIAERDGMTATVTGVPAEVQRRLTALVEAGASHLILSLLPNRPQSWESFAELVLPKLV